MENTTQWTDITRGDYVRKAARYASDLSGREWALIAPLLPGPKPVGRPHVANLREVANAILYMVSTGCQWRMLPKDFPSFSTVQNYFYAWRDMGIFRAINNALVMAALEQEGREASPTAGAIDTLGLLVGVVVIMIQTLRSGIPSSLARAIPARARTGFASGFV